MPQVPVVDAAVARRHAIDHRRPNDHARRQVFEDQRLRDSTDFGELSRAELAEVQPYAELILRGIKTVEYRSRPLQSA